MFKTIVTAHKLMWIGCTTNLLKTKLILSYIWGFSMGLIVYFTQYFISELVNAINKNNFENIYFYFYGLVFLFIGLVLFRYTWRYFFEVTTRVIPFNIKEIYYEKIFNKNYDWHLHNSIGYFSSALNKVCDLTKDWLCTMPYDYLGSATMAVCFLIYTYIVSPIFFLYFVISLLFMFIVIRIMYTKRIKHVAALSQKTIAFDKTYIDFLYNIRSVKKMNLLGFANQTLKEKAKKAVKKAENMMHYNSNQHGFVEVYVNTLFLLPIAYFIKEYVTTGQNLDVIMMIITMHPRLTTISRQYMAMMHKIAQAKTDYNILAEHLGDVFEKEEKEKTIKKWKKISFNNTKFEFVKDGSIFTHEVPDLDINQGDNMAVMGKSGEGKSTFLNLLTRQFMIEQGSIKVDNKNYNTLPESFFNNQITYISQDVELFDMSFYDNIVMGKRIPEDKLNKVLKGCQLQELIKRMGGNLHVDIGEKGIKVSGGERQRINLARGLLLDREILVLDEITANLDPHTTEAIWKFIFDNYNDKTIIAVSHEKELLKHVNRKIEFKKGKCKVIM